MQTFRRSLELLAAVALIVAWPALGAADEPSASSPREFTLALGSAQREAAEAALPALVDRAIRSDDRRLSNRVFSVDSPGAMRDASIGYGFEVYLIDPAALLAGNDIDKSLRRTGIWRFIVVVDNRAVGLVTVARVHGQWKTVQVGGARLAEDISNTVADYVRDPSAPQLRFIRSEQGMADFIQIVARGTGTSPAEPAYIPLLSAQELASPSRLSSAASASTAVASKREALSERRIIDALRASIERGMSNPRFDH